jgi:tetratricopeptide (TPR) repeat protein
MSEKPNQTTLPELEQLLSQPISGLSLLRYHSVQAFDTLLQELFVDRPVHYLNYRPRAQDQRASPSHLVQRCQELAGPAIPVIFLRPDPDVEAASDLDAQATFWKNMNAQREALGALCAQIIMTLDDAQTAACFHHAKDLVSWCSPKFELTTPIAIDSGSERMAVITEKNSSRDAAVSSTLTWRSLYPLLQKELQNGQPLPPRAIEQLLFPLMRHAVDQGAVTLAKFVLDAGDHAAYANERDRCVWLDLKGHLAVAQGDLAVALRSFTESKTMRERLAASDPANAEWQRNLSVSLNKLGHFAVAQNDLAGALRRFYEAKTISERLAASDPANAEWQRDLSISLERLGDLAMAQGDLAGALRSFTESKTIAERLAASDPANTEWQRDLSISLNKLGDLAVEQGDLAGALRYFTEGKTIAERLAASAPANTAWQRDLSVSHNKLGDLAVAQGDLAEALRSFYEAKTIAERLAASDPANAAWQRDLSYSCWLIAAKVFQPQERWAEALELMEQSLCIDERLAATDPTNVMWQKDVQVSRQLVAELRAKVGK